MNITEIENKFWKVGDIFQSTSMGNLFINIPNEVFYYIGARPGDAVDIIVSSQELIIRIIRRYE